ncbi:MAG: ATP-binding protein [Acidobacteria bacterium]|nr:ATP-binding protein [Acidobacteriota bacterium]
MALGAFGGASAETGDNLATLKNQFLASLNHEIRTPLSGILGMTDLLLETRLDAEQQDYVATARNCAHELLNLLNATLEFSLLSAGAMQLEETEFDAAEVVDSAIREFTPQARAKGIQLAWRLRPPSPEIVLGDPMRFRQLLTCLIDNAVKFTHSGAVEVSLEVARDGSGRADASVTVRDTGIGIAPEQIREIFESFRQLSGGLTRTHPGLGLGLAIAQKLAEMMRGEIRVTSELGAGSCFRFHVPFRLPSEPVKPGPAQAGPSKGDYRVLVVDDNPVACKVVTHALTRNGYQVDRAEDGPAALSAARQMSYDLILMDLQMPGIDGLATTDAIRVLPGYAATPVIAFTADSFSETRALCREHGMQGFLTKPVDAAELVSTLRHFLP